MFALAAAVLAAASALHTCRPDFRSATCTVCAPRMGVRSARDHWPIALVPGDIELVVVSNDRPKVFVPFGALSAGHSHPARVELVTPSLELTIDHTGTNECAQVRLARVTIGVCARRIRVPTHSRSGADRPPRPRPTRRGAAARGAGPRARSARRGRPRAGHVGRRARGRRGILRSPSIPRLVGRGARGLVRRAAGRVRGAHPEPRARGPGRRARTASAAREGAAAAVPRRLAACARAAADRAAFGGARRARRAWTVPSGRRAPRVGRCPGRLRAVHHGAGPHRARTRHRRRCASAGLVPLPDSFAADRSPVGGQLHDVPRGPRGPALTALAALALARSPASSHPVDPRRGLPAIDSGG